MASCETTDFVFPLLVDVYYPIVDQGPYGNVKKTWVLDKTIACNFNATGSAANEEIKPNANITRETILIGRVRSDIRVSSLESNNAITNVILTNIRTASGTEIYKETAGTRSGRSTIFEVASHEPFLGPFGSVEYYGLVIRRSENQGVDV